MKIIAVDNFDREERDDELICENVSEHYAKLIVDFLNDKHSGEHANEYYMSVKDDHVLYKFDWGQRIKEEID
jgi:hypothetical protein